MRLPTLPTALAVGVAFAQQTQAARQVFAHYMVGDVTEEHVRQDIIDAAAAGISGFSLNIGDPGADFVANTLSYMFAHAYENGFYVHISMDIIASGDADGGHPHLFDDLLRGYVGHGGYYQVDGKPFVTTFSDGGLTNDEWDAWKLDTLANKLYFCPDFDGTPGYNTSADGWWDYWGDTVDCVFSWDAAWQRRGPEYAGSESPGSIEIDQAVIEDAKSHGKGYMMGLSPLQYKSAYYTNVYRPGELALPKRMENILNMAQRPDYVCVITWNDGPESHYIGNIWPEQNTDPDPARYVTSAKEWSHKGWLPLIHSFSDAFINGGGPSSMSVPYGNQASAIGVMWYKSVMQSTNCPNGDHPDGWELGADQLNWAVVVDPGTDTSGWVLRAFNGKETIEHTSFKSGLNYGAFVLETGTPHMTLSTNDANYIAWGARAVTTDCPDGIFNMNDVVVALDSEACFGASDALTTAQEVASKIIDDYWNPVTCNGRDCHQVGGYFDGDVHWHGANGAESYFTLIDLAGSNSDYEHVAEQFDSAYNTWGASSYFAGSYDDAGWHALYEIRAADYEGSSDLQHMDNAKEIYSYMNNWDDDYCGGGVWWSSDHDYKNTVTNGLFMHLSAALYLRTGTSSYLDNAKKTWNWLKNSGLRRSDGLWLDGARQSGNSCNLDSSSPWTYNQGIVVSGLGVLYAATGDASYLTEAEKTIDAVVAGMSEGGILREPCDDASSNNCNSDQQLFKGVFMKHLEYYLDQANDKARTAKYSQWISAQASGIYHYAIGSSGEPGSVWYAANDGGSQFSVPAALSGLMGLIAAAKYGAASCYQG